MGWGCYKHEWDAGSADWQDRVNALCERKLLKDEPRTFGRDGEVCPACYEELEASHAALAARVEALEGLQHALWHALDDCEERADEVAITMDHFLVLSARLPEDHPEPTPRDGDGQEVAS